LSGRPSRCACRRGPQVRPARAPGDSKAVSDAPSLSAGVGGLDRGPARRRGSLAPDRQTDAPSFAISRTSDTTRPSGRRRRSVRPAFYCEPRDARLDPPRVAWGRHDRRETSAAGAPTRSFEVGLTDRSLKESGVGPRSSHRRLEGFFQKLRIAPRRGFRGRAAARGAGRSSAADAPLFGKNRGSCRLATAAAGLESRSEL